MAGCNKSANEIEPEPEVPTIPPENFPNREFYKFLLENFDTNKDGTISPEEANAVTQIDYSGGDGEFFTSLKGFEYFPNLEKLHLIRIYYNDYENLLDLDVSKNAALTELNIRFANIKTVNVSGNPLLKVLRANDLELKTLDLSHNTQLKFLDVNHSSITELDLRHNTGLEILDVSYSSIKELDLAKNVALRELYCLKNASVERDRKMTKLDVSTNALLEVLNCSGNDLTKLDITKNPKLKELNISENKNITSLNLNQNNELRKLNTTNTQIALLDIKNTQVDTLYCRTYRANRLTLDAKGSRTLKMLECNFAGKLDVSESSIETIVFRDTKYIHIYGYDPEKATFLLNNCPNLKEYYYRADVEGPEQNEVITTGTINLDISHCPSLTKFYSNVLASIKIDNCPKLQELTCKGSFSSIDLSTNKNIRRLEIVNRKLTALNIDALTHLEYLNLTVALDETLNITKNINLKELTVRDNTSPIQRLYVADMPLLKYIRCTKIKEFKIDNCTDLELITNEFYYNPYGESAKLEIENCPNLRKVIYSSCNLEKFDIRNCENLESLNFSGNNLESFRYDGKNLTYLNCSFCSLTSLDINGSSGLETIHCENNQLSALAIDGLSKLRDLYCKGNRLTSLDVSKTPSIDRLDCSANPDLATLYINKNRNFSVFKKDETTKVIYTD
jgi:hypothetical protein